MAAIAINNRHRQSRKPIVSTGLGLTGAKKMSIDSLGGAAGINLQNLQSMDLETALMMVQSERTKLLDSQLQTQIQEVQNRNALVAKLNTVLNGLNAYAAKCGTDAKSTASGWDANAVKDIEVPLNDAMRDAGITDLGFTGNGQRSVLNADGTKQPVATVSGTNHLRGSEITSGGNIMNGGTTKGQIDAAITKVKGQIDALGNTQQMDMLRLQSMSNKRNEAFDVMTNFVKKMQESRSSIIGNMR
ncbi:hypothetical protein [Pigmentiphaga aceris]|uniref:hypothetical protein n=1 Tax=Pigmentiphaga aceris TaxID=1940612 RepID=UPI0016523A3A|nr:hypothetical protein [Pigmentiphaga aceris]